MYGISRTTSRNLIERLLTKQLLVCVSQRVTQVAPLTLLEIKQNFALRKVLLPEIATLAAAKVDFKQLYALNKKIQNMLPTKDDKSALRALKTNRQLNLTIWEKSEYPLMLDWACQLEDTAMRIYWLYIKTKKSFPYSGEQQSLMFDAMKTDDPSKIRQTMRKMFTQTEERMLNAVFSHKQFYTQNLEI